MLRARLTMIASFCCASLLGCTTIPPAVSVLIDGPGGRDALTAARAVERERTALRSGMSAARVIQGFSTGPTLTLNELAAAIGTADTLGNLARAGVPVISIDRRLDVRDAFCLCGPPAPGAPPDRVALAMEILDTALRRDPFRGTADHEGLTRILASEHFRTRAGELRFDGGRVAVVVPQPRGTSSADKDRGHARGRRLQ